MQAPQKLWAPFLFRSSKNGHFWTFQRWNLRRQTGNKQRSQKSDKWPHDKSGARAYLHKPAKPFYHSFFNCLGSFANPANLTHTHTHTHAHTWCEQTIEVALQSILKTLPLPPRRLERWQRRKKKSIDSDLSKCACGITLSAATHHFVRSELALLFFPVDDFETVPVIPFVSKVAKMRPRC